MVGLIGICLFLSMLAACNFTACLFPSLSVGRQWWWEEEMFDLKVFQACLVLQLVNRKLVKRKSLKSYRKQGHKESRVSQD